MASDVGQLSRHDLEAKIVKHCWEDDAFRKEFTADPAGAFVKYLGASVASLPKISVHQEMSGSWHIVIPAKPPNSAELSDEELEKVAGGVTPTVSATVIGTIVGTIATALTASVTVSASKSW
jgi:hypothetical protein